FTIANYADMQVRSAYLTEYSKYINNTELKSYEDMTEADGQGILSLDSYRTLKFLSGSWSKRHEMLYQWEVQKGFAGNKVIMPSGAYFAELAGKEIFSGDWGGIVFNALKVQHFGPAAEAGFNPAFYKLSMLPL